MAYQNPGTPRFYVSILQWLNSIGNINVSTDYLNVIDAVKLIDLNPSNYIQFTFAEDSHVTYRLNKGLQLKEITYEKNGFGVILGHSFMTSNASMSVLGQNGGVFGNQNITSSINYDMASNGIATISQDGWSLWTSDDIHDIESNANSIDYVKFKSYNSNLSTRIGCVAIGNYYDMPHSPELNITMTREMDGIKRTRTKGGADIVHNQYRKPPSWSKMGAWELGREPSEQYNPTTGEPTPQPHKIGRRVWDLNFKQLQDVDALGVNQSFSTYYDINSNYSSDYITSNKFNINVLTENSFFSQVMLKTRGGTLPFIFQPDNSNLNLDNFALAVIDQSSISFKQVANNVYDVKLKIKEIW